MELLRKPSRVSPVFLVLLLFVAGAAQATSFRVHYSMIWEPVRPVPTKVVLLPMDIKVSEVSAGGVVEEVPEWTKTATTNIKHGITEYDAVNTELQILSSPPLSAQESEIVEEHLALYDVVAGSAYWTTTFGGDAWKHKRDRFDYSLGSGLAFMKERTGADAGLIVIGRHQIATAGRVAGSVLAGIFGGVYLPTSVNFLTVGIVDFATGDVLWLNYTAGATGKELKKVESADREILKLLEDFPGLEAYRKFISQ